jgi:hypothetical protein
MSDWRKLAGLSWDDRRTLARAAAMLAHVKLTLPSVDFRTEREAESVGERLSEATLARARAVARLVGIASSRIPLRVACLHRSIVLWRLLRREGIPCELKLGARTDAGPFEAHAWVECAGVALNESEPDLARYSAFGEPVVPVRRGRPLQRLAARRAS